MIGEFVEKFLGLHENIEEMNSSIGKPQILLKTMHSSKSREGVMYT